MTDRTQSAPTARELRRRYAIPPVVYRRSRSASTRRLASWNGSRCSGPGMNGSGGPVTAHPRCHKKRNGQGVTGRDPALTVPSLGEAPVATEDDLVPTQPQQPASVNVCSRRIDVLHIPLLVAGPVVGRQTRREEHLAGSDPRCWRHIGAQDTVVARPEGRVPSRPDEANEGGESHDARQADQGCGVCRDCSGLDVSRTRGGRSGRSPGRRRQALPSHAQRRQRGGADQPARRR